MINLYHHIEFYIQTRFNFNPKYEPPNKEMAKKQITFPLMALRKAEKEKSSSVPRLIKGNLLPCKI